MAPCDPATSSVLYNQFEEGRLRLMSNTKHNRGKLGVADENRKVQQVSHGCQEYTKV